ncbi:MULTISPECIES: site-specific integrase [unclassified Herbaspirillum]|uniref:tyrosine-type recombinase/integrase n=1 Tax=unclassified Herbaspirillum TaxID=2624150 RepID=UPI001172DBC5|nr:MULTISPECIES: site-specific integrase [unclassified Herbaspirillum]TQK13038.1 site-specific recombinase XerD [Herbaspirillum sp. SJZ130]TQK15042.1 site-specific recombinase XerD [Herbaspirillum sp. SJZ106]TWC67399.1 site-specific recombinase XerD [Herbaspirillum sp. SJZ099]
MGSKTWDDAVNKWLEDKADKRSLKSDQSNIRWLNRFLSGIPLRDIDREVVASLRTKKIASGASNATVNRMLALLRAILRMAVIEWEWMPAAPHVRLLREPVRRVRFLSPKQAVRLLAELPPHLAAMAAFSLATGLRRANVTGLRWEQVDMKRRIAWFDGEDMKNGNPQTVPLNDDAMRVLIARHRTHPVYVFTYKGNKIVQASTAAWYKALERAGIQDFRWHDLRHTWASWHVQSGTPLLALQELGGWESAEMVRRYAHFSQLNLSTFAANLPTMMRPSCVEMSEI